jgi:integrase
MPTLSLDARTVLNLKPPAAGQVDYFDDNPAGFGLRLSPSGTKTWIYCYRFDGRPRRWTIGRYPAISLAKARGKAKAGERDVANGSDPAEQKQIARAADTFGDLAADFLKRYRKRDGTEKISRDEDERIINQYLLPEWKHRKAAKILRRDVKALVSAIAAGDVEQERKPAPVMANRVLALISTIYNFGIEEESVEANPAYRVKRPGAEQTRDRVLAEDEIRALWTALEAEPVVYRAFYRLALLTGQRMGGKRHERGEILWMRWSEIDDSTHWWTIPATRTKNGIAHRIYLTKTVRAELDALKAYQAEKELSSEYVFVTPRSKDEPVTGAKHVIRRIKARILKTAEADGTTDSPGLDFRPHDLRRTVATMMTSHGITRETVRKILNHTDSKDITGIYDRHTYDPEKQVAWETWERTLKGIVNPKPKRGAKVLPMRGRAGR